MKKCKNYEKKKGNRKWNLFNDLNEVDNINFQTGNKIEKLKRLFPESSLKALDIFAQFLLRGFELGKPTEKIKERCTRN